MFKFSLHRALLIAGMQLGIGEAIDLLPQRPLPPPQTRRRGKKVFVGRAQDLIADRSSNIRKLQRSPIPLMQPDERARKRHIHPRSKRGYEHGN